MLACAFGQHVFSTFLFSSLLIFLLVDKFLAGQEVLSFAGTVLGKSLCLCLRLCHIHTWLLSVSESFVVEKEKLFCTSEFEVLQDERVCDNRKVSFLYTETDQHSIVAESFVGRL